jgi:hypothetical protein
MRVCTLLMARTSSVSILDAAQIGRSAKHLANVPAHRRRLNVSAQVALPGWVRGRGIAIYVSVFYGAITIGSALWGTVADALGFTITHFVAAAGMLAGIPATSRWRLHTGKQLDLTPSMHWPAPVFDRSLRESNGRVLVMVEYRINTQDRTPFLAAIEDLGQERRRDGAYAWGIFEDVAEDDRFLETFLVESWLEYLRQHERATRRGRELAEIAEAFSRGGKKPTVTHLIAAEFNNPFPARHKRAWRYRKGTQVPARFNPTDQPSPGD